MRKSFLSKLEELNIFNLNIKELFSNLFNIFRLSKLNMLNTFNRSSKLSQLSRSKLQIFHLFTLIKEFNNKLKIKFNNKFNSKLNSKSNIQNVLKLCIFLFLFNISANALNTNNQAKYSLEFVDDKINPYQFSLDFADKISDMSFIKVSLHHQISGSLIPIASDKAYFFFNVSNLIEPMLLFRKHKIEALNNIDLETFDLSAKFLNKVSIKFSNAEYKRAFQNEYELLEINLAYHFQDSLILYSHWIEKKTNSMMLCYHTQKWKMEIGGVLQGASGKNDLNRFCYHFSRMYNIPVKRANIELGFLTERKRERVIDLIKSIVDMDMDTEQNRLDVSFSHAIRAGFLLEDRALSLRAYVVLKFADQLALTHLEDSVQKEAIFFRHIELSSSDVKWRDNVFQHIPKYFSLHNCLKFNLSTEILKLEYKLKLNTLNRSFTSKFKHDIALGVQISGFYLEYSFNYRSPFKYYDKSDILSEPSHISNLALLFASSKLIYSLKVKNLFDSSAEYKSNCQIEKRSLSLELRIEL